MLFRNTPRAYCLLVRAGIRKFLGGFWVASGIPSRFVSTVLLPKALQSFREGVAAAGGGGGGGYVPIAISVFGLGGQPLFPFHRAA